MDHEVTQSRREFMRTASLAAGSIIVVWPGDDQKISPSEHLMRQHGLVKRILLIYDEVASRVAAGKDIPPVAVSNAAGIARSFIADYHEKLEEDFLFPRFEKEGKLTDLVGTLRTQHQQAAMLTERIMQNATLQAMQSQGARTKLAADLHAFMRMYNAHTAWEDTVLFPAFRTMVSTSEYNSLGEDFEKREREKLGQDGFGKHVEKLGQVERSIGIADLARYNVTV